jgi:hypothetical protein
LRKTQTQATKTLTLGMHEGRLPVMFPERTFNVVLVSKQKPAGFSFTTKPDKSVHYQGKAVEVKFD